MGNNKKVINKKYKKKLRKKQIIRNRLIFFSLIMFLLGTGFLIKNIYIKFKCTDLQYAIEYYLTSGRDDNRLMRVQTITLVFSDNDSAIVQAFGLRKDKPHSQIGVEGHFSKGHLNSWKLEDSYLVEN